MNNTSNDGEGAAALQHAILGVLTRICNAYGHTFSWYTSKKSRVWIQFKGFSPTVYSTAVELPAGFREEDTLDGLEVLLAKHIPKVLQEEPPLTTWTNAKGFVEALPHARAYCSALYARYLAGESLLPADYPYSPIPDEGGDADE